MLDTMLVESTPVSLDESIFVVRFMEDLAKLYGRQLPAPPETTGMSVEEQLATLIRHAQAAQVLPPEVGLAQVQNQFRVFQANAKAMLAYHVRPYPGRIWYFQAQDGVSRSSAWNPFAGGGLEQRIVPGNHYTMLRPPHLDGLAGQLRASLRHAR